MKIIIAFVVGIALGLAAAAGLLYLNPLYAQNDPVPINTDADWSLTLATDGHFGGALVHTHSDTLPLPRVPTDVEELWHPAHKGVHAFVHAFENQAGEVIGVGVKFAAISEASRALPTKLLLDSDWNVLLPAAGSFFVSQTENYWPFARAVMLPAWKDKQRHWEGTFDGDTTVGPSGTLEAIMIGASGVLRGQRGVAKEAITASRVSLPAQHTAGTAGAYRQILTIVADEPPVSDEPPLAESVAELAEDTIN